MQINKRKDEHLIFPKIKDGTTYLLLFAASLVFTELIISVFILPLRWAIPLKRPDLVSEIEAGVIASKYAYNHIVSLSSVVIQVIAYLLFLSIIGIICYRVLRVEFQNFKMKLGKNIVMIFAFGIIIYIVDIFVANIYAILGEGGTSMNQLMIYGALSSPARIVTILLTVLLAPIVEELIFRKFMFGALHQRFKLPIWAAGVLSAVIFALIHVSSSVEQLIFFPQYFALAMVLVGAYIYSGQNIYFSIGVHIFNNAVSIIIWAINTLI